MTEEYSCPQPDSNLDPSTKVAANLLLRPQGHSDAPCIDTSSITLERSRSETECCRNHAKRCVQRRATDTGNLYR